MRVTGLLFILLLSVAATASVAVEIRSVFPAVVTAGTPVTIIGGPFSSQVLIDLAGQQLKPRSIGSRQLIFIVPELPTGEHALFIRDGEQTSATTFSLRVEQPAPLIESLSPANLNVCSRSEQRQLVLRGANIQTGAQLLLDGAVVPFRNTTDGAMSFSPPALPAGSYGLQVVNPDGKQSLPHTLWFSNIPEIEEVSQGENYVNFYQVLIRGRNFFHNSVLLIDEYPAGFADLPPRQRVISARGGPVFQGSEARPRQSESVTYQDCTTLIYYRFPPSGQAMRIVLRVGNPDGKQTPGYEVFLP